MQSFRAALKIFLFILINLLLVPPHVLIYLIHRGDLLYILPRIYHRLACAVFQIRISQNGEPLRDTQTLFISNHLSYLDIPLLGAVLPSPHFVAKKDVQDWPVWGVLAKLQQTAFISRNRQDAKKETQSLEAMINASKNLVVFAEGTSTDGHEIAPFKSSLFTIAMNEPPAALCIQPVTLNVTALNGQPHSGGDRANLYAWPRELDMELVPHLWRFAKSKGVTLEVVFGAPIKPQDYSDRKTLAKACHDAVCNGLKH